MNKTTNDEPRKQIIGKKTEEERERYEKTKRKREREKQIKGANGDCFFEGGPMVFALFGTGEAGMVIVYDVMGILREREGLGSGVCRNKRGA